MSDSKVAAVVSLSAAPCHVDWLVHMSYGYCMVVMTTVCGQGQYGTLDSSG